MEPDRTRRELMGKRHASRIEGFLHRIEDRIEDCVKEHFPDSSDALTRRPRRLRFRRASPG